MSSFHKNPDRVGLYANKILKYLVIGIVLLGITYFVLGLLQNTLDQEFISLNLLIFSEISAHILNVIMLLFLGVFATLTVKYLYNRNKILMEIILFFLFFLITFIFGSIYFTGQNPLSTLYLLGAFFSELFSTISNLLPFLIILPFVVLFYFKKIKIAAKYKLKNLSFRNNVLLVDDGKARKYKGLSILEITNIPKNIVIKEDRPQKKAIEKLMIPGDMHYLHYHLTSLAKAIPEFAFEIRVEKNDIRLQFIITAAGIEINEIVNQIEVQKNILESVLQVTFPGLKFQLLQGNLLKAAWEEIFGGWGSYKVKFIEKNKIEINKIVEKTYISILKCEDVPYFKIINNASQIDSMIRGLMGSHLNLNYVVAGTPIEIHDFEKQKKGIEREVQNFTREGYSKFSKGKEFKETYKPLKYELEEDKIRTELSNIRHAEITGLWKVSSYISIRSNDKNQHDNDIQRVKALFSTIFGIELKILESTSLERSFHRIFMRNLIDDPLTLTSEQLAILIHLPENPIPSLSRVDIPEFEIPPENKVRDGISIGKILYYDQEMYPLRLSIDELRLNTFICGLIGMGKTRCAMNIMKQLATNYPDVNWMCLDWKGEYRYLLNEIKSQKIVVLIPGSEIFPIHLNMFDPQKSNSDEHARKLFAIIREVFKSEFNKETDLSAQMETVCKEVLRTVIKNPRMRNLNSFLEELKNYGKEKSAENKTIMMTINALINRFDRFRHGVLKNVLDVKKSNIDFDNLMGEKVVFDLNYLLSKGGAKEDVRLLMNLILKYVIDKALERGIADTLKHIILIEDSQLLVPSVLREVPETSLVEDIPLLLRGVGESLITIATRPEISADILANSGIKISFKSPYDSEKIARYQNLTENQEKYLRIMPKREAIVNLPNFQFPFRVVTDHFEYEKISEEQIYSQNVLPSNIYEREHQISIQQNDTDISTRIELKNSSDPNSNLKNLAISQENNLKKMDIKNTDESNRIELAKLQEILKLKPLNKKGLSEKLGFPKEELDGILNGFINKKQIISFLAPIFNKKAKQKFYSLPNLKNYVKEEVITTLENDFMKNGKIGKLSEEDTFDYIWYGNNIFMKILDLMESPLNTSEIGNLLLKWFEEAVERGSYELLIIIPFYDAAEAIRNWLNGQQILIFSYYIEDWNKLKDYLNNGTIPDWNIKENYKSERVLTDNLKETFFYEKDEIKKSQGFQSKLNSSNSLKNSELESNLRDNIKMVSITKEELQKQWIHNIQTKYPDKLSFQTLERFNKNFPSINELAEELGCTIYNTEKELRGLMAYLKSVEIHDLYEPLNLKQRYFSWKNENLGQNLMELELRKLFDGKKIDFKRKEMGEGIKTLVTNENFLIYLIFEEPDFQKFLQIIEPENFLNKFNRIALIVHTIELKYQIEDKLKDTRFTGKIEVYLYDWSSIGPMVRNLALKPSKI